MNMIDPCSELLGGIPVAVAEQSAEGPPVGCAVQVSGDDHGTRAGLLADF
jgi:hypothetical protein